MGIDIKSVSILNYGYSLIFLRSLVGDSFVEFSIAFNYEYFPFYGILFNVLKDLRILVGL